MWEQLQNTQPQMFVFNVLLPWSAVGEKEIGVQNVLLLWSTVP